MKYINKENLYDYAFLNEDTLVSQSRLAITPDKRTEKPSNSPLS